MLTAMAFTAHAQYNTSADLVKKGGNVYQNDVRLSTEELSLMLPEYSKAKNMRTTGIVLTSTGSAAVLTGPVVLFVGIAKVIGSGIGSGISGNPDGVVGEGEVTAGLVITGAGVAMLGSGIPLWCIGGKRIKNMVADHNGQSRPDVTLALGPCPNGLGLSLNF